MMTTRVAHCHGDTSGYFGQGVLRPPVPGEENTNSDTVRPESYEPEGRDSSDYAHPSWAESLQSLLDDQDGISLFRDFLAQEGLTDLIDFWLACRGFQLAFLAPVSCLSTSLDVINKRRLKLAKAIYRKYIISNGVVTKRIRAMTKNSLCERICHLELDSALFLQAKQEVQDGMEAEVYPLFLKSYLFLTNAQETCIEQKVQTWELNTHKQETGNDQQEMNSSMQEPESGKKELKQKTENKQREVLQFFPEQVETNHKRPEHWEAGYNLRHRVQGCVKANGHKTTRRHKDHVHHILKDVHAEPHKFAADLISRLKLVQRERKNWRRVEEHPHPVSTQEDDNFDGKVFRSSTSCPSHLVPPYHGSSHSAVQCWDLQAENHGVILDQHAQSKTEAPSWSSPTTHTLSHTCSRSGDTWHPGEMAGTDHSAGLVYSSRGKCVCEIVKVAYYFCGEPIPYRSTFRGQAITLAQFKQLLTKKGEYRFFFKKASDEFDCGVVYEEVCEDDAVLPVFQGKIIGKVEKTY